MASGLTSGLGIAGIIFIIIGIIMAVIGIVLLISRSTTTTTEWYIWLLIIGGIVIGIIGGIMLAVALAYAPVTPVVPAYTPVPQVAPQPVQYVQHSVVAAPVAQPVITAPVAQPVRYVQQPMVAAAPAAPVAATPQRVVSQQVERVSAARFDPDPQTTVQRIRPPPMRGVFRGPYGPNGEEMDVTGVYQPAEENIYTTTDITDHSVAPVASTQAMYAPAVAAPVYRGTY